MVANKISTGYAQLVICESSRKKKIITIKPVGCAFRNSFYESRKAFYDFVNTFMKIGKHFMIW